MAQALSTAQIEERIKNLSGWSTDGRKIERIYSIRHIQGAAFIMHIAAPIPLILMHGWPWTHYHRDGIAPGPSGAGKQFDHRGEPVGELGID
jgi:hypothetical protein